MLPPDVSPTVDRLSPKSADRKLPRETPPGNPAGLPTSVHRIRALVGQTATPWDRIGIIPNGELEEALGEEQGGALRRGLSQNTLEGRKECSKKWRPPEGARNSNNVGRVNVSFVLQLESSTDRYRIVEVKLVRTTFGEGEKAQLGSDSELEDCVLNAYRGTEVLVRGIEPGQRLRFGSGAVFHERMPPP